MSRRSKRITRKERHCQTEENCLSPGPSDDELIARSLAGEHEAFDELDLRYRQKAYVVARNILGNEDVAWDAIQIAFLNAYTHLNQFQGRSSFWTWLRRIVCNAAKDLGVAESRRRAKEREIAAARPTEETLTPLDLLLSTAYQEWLKRHSEPLILLICKLLVEEELTYAEMAGMIGTTVWQVRKAVIRLHLKLQEYLDL